jgi:hypothetical protein
MKNIFGSPARPDAPHPTLAAFVCCVILLGSASTAAAQSADKIIRQATKAMGGEAALKRVKGWQASGSITRQRDGVTGRYQVAAMQPNFYAQACNIGGFEMGAGFTGKSSWRRDSRDGLRTLTGEASDSFQAEAWYRNHRWLDYKKERAKLAYAGATTVNNKSAHAVTLTTARGVKIKLHFDVASGLLVKEELAAGKGVKTFEYNDYRAINGVKEAFAITISEDGERYEIKLAEVAHHQQLDRALFDFPRPADELPPDLDALFTKLREHQAELEQLREKYTYTETITSYQLDKQGAVKEKESEAHELTFYRHHRLRRLVAKNGQMLSSSDQAKEDRRIEKIIRDIEAGKEINVPHNQRRLKLSDLLRISRFVNPRRERFRERQVIVFDFEPNPNFKPANMDESFVHKLAGSIWIDAADLQVARVEFQLIEAFKVAGGAFFAMKPGSRFVTEQDRFNNEIWLPTYTEVTISAQAMLFAKFGINQKTAYEGYRRFDVNAEEKLKAPPTEKKTIKL